MIPTVRVANPADPRSFMTINAVEYRPAAHGPLWHEQAPGFQGLPTVVPVLLSQAERDFAGTLFLEMVELRYSAEGKGSFATLSPAERMVALRDLRTDFERDRRKWEANTAIRTGDLFSYSRAAIPGETPSYPADAITGKALVLDEATRQQLSEIKISPAGDEPPTAGLANPRGELIEPDPVVPPGLPPLGEDTAEPAPVAPQAEPAAALPPQPQEAQPSTPSWAKVPAAPAPSVQKGPGGKYYVMRGTEVLSEGFPTKAKAEAELENHTA